MVVGHGGLSRGSFFFQMGREEEGETVAALE
jgi:hypothetical protein